MSQTLLYHVTLYQEGTLLPDQYVLIEAGKIIATGHIDGMQEISADESIDFAGDYLAPGFIDLHMHGIQNYLIDNGRADIESISSILPRYGTTGFLPTIIPHPPEIEEDYLKEAAAAEAPGAEILGYFCEGPFLAKTGAITPSALKDQSMGRMESIRALLKPYRTIFAVSPEIDGAVDLIKEMDKPVFMTHTQASVEQADEAIRNGAKHATHFYDVFPIPEETDPGVRPCGCVESILTAPDVSVDFILDGEHVHPAAVKLAKACKSITRIALITDSNIGAGFPPGTYEGFGYDEISFAYPGAPARGTENSQYPGSLFGSGLTMDQAVRNVLKFSVGSLEEGLTMASKSPAGILGIEDHKGDTLAGYDADLVRLSHDLEVMTTWVSGKIVYSQSEELEETHE